MLAVPLLAYHLTHSALSTGGAFIAEIVPFSIFSLVGGSLADRLDRRRLMIGCDAIRFLVMAFFAIAYWQHFLTLPMIYGGLVDHLDLRRRISRRTVVEHSVPARQGALHRSHRDAPRIRERVEPRDAGYRRSNLCVLRSAAGAYLKRADLSRVAVVAPAHPLARPRHGAGHAQAAPPRRRRRARIPPNLGRRRHARSGARGIRLQLFRLRLLRHSHSVSEERLRRERSSRRHLFRHLGGRRRAGRVVRIAVFARAGRSAARSQLLTCSTAWRFFRSFW